MPVGYENNGTNGTIGTIGLGTPGTPAGTGGTPAAVAPAPGTLSGSAGFNGVLGATTQSINTSANAINARLANFDPTDPGSLLQMQQQLANYNLAITVTSSLIKSLEDTVKSVAQKLS